jgi:hypothetical protein
LRDAAAARFDQVIAADVFIYIGALEDLFHDSAQPRPGGWSPSRPKECEAADYTRCGQRPLCAIRRI